MVPAGVGGARKLNNQKGGESMLAVCPEVKFPEFVIKHFEVALEASSSGELRKPVGPHPPS